MCEDGRGRSINMKGMFHVPKGLSSRQLCTLSLVQHDFSTFKFMAEMGSHLKTLLGRVKDVRFYTPR